MADPECDDQKRPFFINASLTPDVSDDADAKPPPVRSNIQKLWRQYRHTLLVGAILVVCFGLVLCFFTTQGAVVARSLPPQKVWRAVPRVPAMNTSEFRAFVGPLIQMSVNAYTWPRVQPIGGWQLAGDVLGFVGSLKGGMHALTYVDQNYNNTQQIVIAFRGVNLADTLDGLADRCADFLLWSGGYKEGRNFDFPFQCQEKFTYRTLGYYSQAVDHTKSVLEAFPGASILLTGHGLGAGLALLVSSSNLSPVTGPMPVVAFSAPSVGHALQARNLKMWKDEDRLAYVIGDRWDGEMSTSDKLMRGHVCLFNTTEPGSCATCRAERIVAQEPFHRKLLETESRGVVSEPSVSSDCSECSQRTHDLNHVATLVATQERPDCT